MTSDYRVGDIGVALVVTLADDDGPVDLSLATAATLRCLLPDGTTADCPATAGDAGAVTAAFPAGFLAQAGSWRYQVVVEGPGYVLHSEVGKFRVGEVI